MKKMLKKISLIVLALACLFIEIPFQLFADDSQVIKPGGFTASTQLTQDGVSMSKTIEKTDKENYFDITLEVKTETLVDEIKVDQSIAVALVVDTSNSMSWCMDANSSSSDNCDDGIRLDNAKAAMNAFVTKFFEEKATAIENDPTVKREIALVSFNRNVTTNVAFGSDAAHSETLFKQKVNSLTNSSGTNLAAGLKRAAELFESDAAKNIKTKYIIVLTDGYPTVYNTNNYTSVSSVTSSSGTNGYNNTGAEQAYSVALDNKNNEINTYVIGVGVDGQSSYYGINYKYEVGYTTKSSQSYQQISFTDAVSQDKAILIGRNGNYLSVNDSGNIYNHQIGASTPTDNDFWIIESVDGGYKLKNKKTGTYLNNENGTLILDSTGIILKNNSNRLYYTIDKNKYYLRYENGWQILNGKGDSRNLTFYALNVIEKYDMLPVHFKEWLGGHAVYGGTADGVADLNTPWHGIGYVKDSETNKEIKSYYDVDNSTALNDAYDKIFEQIKIEVDRLNKAWVATDPMNAALPKYISFEGFYSDDNNDNISDTIAAELEYGDNSLNNATFSNDTINWNLRESKPYKIEQKPGGKDDESIFTYQLKYRIRLNNEIGDFIDDLGEELATNGTAKLTYAVTDSEGNITELRTENFKVPTVIGYLGTLEFTKLSEDETTLLKGAKFELVHDDENCECKIYKDGVNEKDPATSSDFENITATSNENGKVIFNKVIPSGHTYILKEITAPNNHVKSDKTYKVNVSYGTVTVYDGDNELIPESEINYFDAINKLDEGKLEVTKKLQDEHIDTNKSFEFELETNTVRDSYTWTKYDSTGEEIDSGITQIVDGKAAFTLKHNEKISIDLPLTTKYKITEKNNPNYDVNYTNREGIITKNTTSNVIVKNTTKPTYMDVHKTWKNTDGFTTLPSVNVTLYKKYGNGSWTEVGTQTLSASNNWYYKWERLNGEYEYKVDEDEIPEFFVKEVSCDSESKHCEITNTNTAGVDLPKTGSSTMLILVLTSTSMMLFSFVYGCKYYLKK